LDCTTIAGRTRAHRNIAERPELMQIFAAVFVGPEAVPAEAFSDERIAAACGD